MDGANTEIEKISDNPLLKGPELITPEQINLKNQQIGFTFSFGNEDKVNWRSCHLGLNEGKPFFEIKYLKSLPDELSKEEKQKFTTEQAEIDGEQRTIYAFRYGPIPPPRPKDTRGPETPKGTPQGYIVHQRREFRSNQPTHPKVISPQDEKNFLDLAQSLKSKHVLFYTGAGLSVGSGVHSMGQLHQELNFDPRLPVDHFIKKSLANPEEILKNWGNFTDKALYSPPTPAHFAVARMAQNLHCPIFTENVDLLQERSGVIPIRIDGPSLRENVKPEYLKDIDYVVTVGLSHDDRGFLGWYKEHNPQGKIVAINRSQPKFLGDEDILVAGDLQQIIPQLEQQVDHNE